MRSATLAGRTVRAAVVIGVFAAVCGMVQAAVAPPTAAPWWLGPELITNGGFEGDTPGSLPAGWTAWGGTAVATAAGKGVSPHRASPTAV